MMFGVGGVLGVLAMLGDLLANFGRRQILRL
jgi:hypothetical protein